MSDPVSQPANPSEVHPADRPGEESAGPASQLRLATAELLGVLAYGQLRSFAAMSSAVQFAPDARSADRIATFARREHEAYESLHDHLAELTTAPTAAMDRQKGLFDRFFARAPLDDWFGACVFFAFGIPLARDFMRTVVPMLEPASGDVVLRTLQDRAQVEEAAVALLRAQLTTDVLRERARGIVADLLGQALTAFQQAAGDSDALQVLLGGAEDASSEVRLLAMQLLTAHRGRLVTLGLEDPEDLAQDA
jgi:hypothetical protein